MNRMPLLQLFCKPVPTDTTINILEKNNSVTCNFEVEVSQNKETNENKCKDIPYKLAK